MSSTDSILNHIGSITISASGLGDDWSVDDISILDAHGKPLDNEDAGDIIEEWFMDATQHVDGDDYSKAHVVIQREGEAWSVDSKIQYEVESDGTPVLVEVTTEEVESLFSCLSEGSRRLIESGCMNGLWATIQYSGSGDSGDIDCITVEKTKGMDQASWDDFMDSIRSLSHQFLATYAQGYEVGNGSSGAISLTFGEKGVQSASWSSIENESSFEFYDEQIGVDDLGSLFEQLNEMPQSSHAPSL